MCAHQVKIEQLREYYIRQYWLLICIIQINIIHQKIYSNVESKEII